MNTNVVKGIVSQVKDKTTAYGTMYDIRVDGKWYGAGKNHPGVQAGDAVEFVAKQNGNFSNVVGKVEKTATVSVASQAPVASASAAPVVSSSSGYVDTRQLSICFQSARNAALEMVSLLAQGGALPFSDSNAAKAKASRQGAFEALVDHYTELFYKDTQDLGARFIDKEPDVVVERNDEWT